MESASGSDSATATVQGSHCAESIVADISATIARFKAPADSGKIKIVVAPLRSSQSSFDIGGPCAPAAKLQSGTGQLQRWLPAGAASDATPAVAGASESVARVDSVAPSKAGAKAEKMAPANKADTSEMDW